MLKQSRKYPYDLCTNSERKRWYPEQFAEDKNAEQEDAWYTAFYGGADIPGVHLVKSVVSTIRRASARKQFRLNDQVQTTKLNIQNPYTNLSIAQLEIRAHFEEESG